MSSTEDPSFSVDAVEDGDCDVLQVFGEIDLGNADEFARCIATRNPARNVIIDMRGVAFLDATGARALLEASHERRRHGSSVHLVKPSHDRAPRRVLDLLQLDQEIPSHDHYSDAADAADC